MKNIYLLPTQNNKSKLAIYHYEGSKNIKVGEIGLQVNNNIGWTNCWSERELYITSEEEIKEGDWYFNKKQKIPFKCISRDNGTIRPNHHHLFNCKKIILTTDPNLIKDGVQGIDDEFLDWFVQNRSCKKVEVVEDYRKCCRSIDGANENCIEAINCEGWLNNEYEKPYKTDCEKRFEGYKIIIPKEEPIHTSYTGKVWEPSKQETVEEAAEKYWSRQPYNEDPFVEGVKWQQERSYSKEEVWKLVNKLNQTLNIGSDLTLEEWFEQFKKK